MKGVLLIYHGRRLYYLMKTKEVSAKDNIIDSGKYNTIDSAKENTIDSELFLAQHPLERLDNLILDDMKLWQRTDQFCFSIDAVILAHFVPIKQRFTYADLGTGTGVLPLILTARGAKQVVGFELNPITADLAERNRRLNKKEDSITIVQGDYCQLPMAIYNGAFDCIVANPPYFDVQHGKAPMSKDRQVALHESHTTIEEVAQAASRLVKFGGMFCMIYGVERLMKALMALEAAKLTPKRLRFVHSFSHRDAKLVLIEARKGGREGLQTMPPLYIYEELNVYSEEVRTWYGK